MGWLWKAIYPTLSPDGALPYPHWRAPPRLRIRVLPKILQRCKLLRDNKSTYIKPPKSGNGCDSFSFQDRPTVLHTGTLHPVSIALQYALTMATALASSNTNFFVFNQSTRHHQHISHGINKPLVRCPLSSMDPGVKPLDRREERKVSQAPMLQRLKPP